MSINARFARTTILMLSLQYLSVLQAAQFAQADSPFTTLRNAVESQTGKHVRMLMSELHPFQPSLPTFVITHDLGGRGRILAFNPPNAAGGYKTPDLRTCADLAWSFQTYSIFDTQDQIAHVGFFLETHANATDRDQHVAGVAWLADRVRSDETNWLLMQYHPTETGVETFDAIAAISGELLTEKHPFRHRPPEVRSHSRASVPLVTSTP